MLTSHQTAGKLEWLSENYIIHLQCRDVPLEDWWELIEIRSEGGRNGSRDDVGDGSIELQRAEIDIN